nr:hypothetical protein [uncultured Bacteroides sp.]
MDKLRSNYGESMYKMALKGIKKDVAWSITNEVAKMRKQKTYCIFAP